MPRKTQAQWMAKISEAVQEMVDDSTVNLNTRLENLEVVYNHVGTILSHVQDRIEDEEEDNEDLEDEEWEARLDREWDEKWDEGEDDGGRGEHVSSPQQ